ncbi:MAG: type II toxin-antitoxin system RelE/ParE family toxin [Candidatus Brockarchaeota archaeon]|nr:type II toxin-antitoxin system RelE/ParE family toxin [Candidatus Brockarchaeota archaeon]
MAFKVVLTHQALKSFEKLPPKIKQRVSEALDTLVQTPVPFRSFDVNKLKGYRNTYRIRIGRWRIVYEYDSKTKTIIVHDVLSRERAY